MTDPNERVDVLADLLDGVKVALDAVVKAPNDVKELDVVAYSEVIDNLNAASGIIKRLRDMAQIDADVYNKMADTVAQANFDRRCDCDFARPCA